MSLFGCCNQGACKGFVKSGGYGTAGWVNFPVKLQHLQFTTGSTEWTTPTVTAAAGEVVVVIERAASPWEGNDAVPDAYRQTARLFVALADTDHLPIDLATTQIDPAWAERTPENIGCSNTLATGNVYFQEDPHIGEQFGWWQGPGFYFPTNGGFSYDLYKPSDITTFPIGTVFKEAGVYYVASREVPNDPASRPSTPGNTSVEFDPNYPQPDPLWMLYSPIGTFGKYIGTLYHTRSEALHMEELAVFGDPPAFNFGRIPTLDSTWDWHFNDSGQLYRASIPRGAGGGPDGSNHTWLLGMIGDLMDIVGGEFNLVDVTSSLESLTYKWLVQTDSQILLFTRTFTNADGETQGEIIGKAQAALDAASWDDKGKCAVVEAIPFSGSVGGGSCTGSGSYFGQLAKVECPNGSTPWCYTAAHGELCIQRQGSSAIDDGTATTCDGAGKACRCHPEGVWP
jgi:hypothetical protein